MPEPTFADHTAITRKVYEYAYGIDTRNWDLYRSIFTEHIRMDFSSYNSEPASDLSADEWVSNVQVLFTGLDATQHSMTNPLIDLADNQTARCRMYMQAEHFLLENAATSDQNSNGYALGGYYDNQLVKKADGWKICAVTLNVTWQSGNRSIMQMASERGLAKLS